jgi:outer membrane immunogenic protein
MVRPSVFAGVMSAAVIFGAFVSSAAAQGTPRWGGAYIGAQIGGAWGKTSADSGPLTGFNQTYGYNSQGAVGGAYLGYNIVTNGLVWGVEGDLEASGLSKDGIGTLGYLHRTKLDWLGSVRGRLGFTSGPALFYATGGVAFGDVKITKAVTPTTLPFAEYGGTRTGYTIGAGLDYAFASNLIGRLEYRYTDLGKQDFSSTAVNSIDSSRFDFHAVRAGIAYKF